MKKNTRMTGREFDRMLDEAIAKSIRKILKEDWFDDMDSEFDSTPYGDDDDNSYTGDLLKSNEKGMGSVVDILNKGDDEKIIAQTSAEQGDEEEEDDSIENVSFVEEPESDDALFKDAYDAIESSDGSVAFDEWFSGLEDVDRNAAQTAFNNAKREFETRDSYETDEVPVFSGRHEGYEPEHKAGNVIDFEGVEINDDGKQYVMVANESNPRITVRGSSLNAVKNTYNSLWSDVSKMEDKARKMGMTDFYGALLYGDDYDSYVRSAGAHNPDFPIIIDLDRMKGKNIRNTISDGDMFWLEPFKHGNNKYMMTDYQVGRLTPEQRAKWAELRRTNPSVYTSYVEVPSEKKANRYKK